MRHFMPSSDTALKKYLMEEGQHIESNCHVSPKFISILDRWTDRQTDRHTHTHTYALFYACSFYALLL